MPSDGELCRRSSKLSSKSIYKALYLSKYKALSFYLLSTITMKYIFTIFFTALFLSSFSQSKSANQVKAALEGQIAAWNSGRLEEAMAYYHNSPELLWISRAGIEKGYQPVYESYLKDFSDRTAMGIFTYEPLHIETLSPKNVYFVYRWKIELKLKARLKKYLPKIR